MNDAALRALPKAHLHLHLYGGASPALLADAASEQSVPNPTIPHRYPTFADFQRSYDAIRTILRSVEKRRLVSDVLGQSAAAGAIWTEIHVAVHSDAELDELIDAGRYAEAEHGVGLGWVLLADRSCPDKATAQARRAVRRAGRGVVAFGLAGDEAANHAKHFVDAFRIARLAGLPIVPHAGETTGPLDVRYAVESLGATRIAHGIQAASSRSVLRTLAERQVCLDVAPLANVAFGIYPANGAPVRRILDADVPITLNADDPLLFGAGLLEAYGAARRSGCSDGDLTRMAAWSLDHSAAPASIRHNMTARTQRQLERTA
jgi:adenosine deaminase